MYGETWHRQRKMLGPLLQASRPLRKNFASEAHRSPTCDAKIRTDPPPSAYKNDVRLLNISTWTPPGRLTDESMRTASCRALASTFHLRGCTFHLSLCHEDTSMSKIRTSVIRPITRSPTSGLYLHGKWVIQVNQFKTRTWGTSYAALVQ